MLIGIGTEEGDCPNLRTRRAGVLLRAISCINSQLDTLDAMF